MKEKVVTEIPTDEIISDSVLRRKRLKTNILFSSILTLVGLLAITIITMSCIKIDLRPRFVENPSHVSIISNGKQVNFDSSDTEIYNNFDEIYKSMFSISFLSGLFTGNTGNYTINEKATNEYLWYTDSTENAITETVKSIIGDNYVKLHYEKNMKLYNSDGTVYQSKYNDTYEIYFNNVYFALSDVNETREFTFAFEIYGNLGERHTITQIKLRANTYQLYKTFIEQ